MDKGVPSCPQHPDGWVVRNGRYGTKPRQRQRWRCTPADGTPPHNFAGNVVRSVLASPGTCESCEQHVARHQGPGLASLYRYPVTEVALALVRVGRGMSYTEAAQRCRARQARELFGPQAEQGELAKRPTAQLVANWVEVFGPVVAAGYAETRWPETIVVDDKPFQANTSMGRGVVFSILGVWGYEAGASQGRLVALRAVRGGASQHHWRQVYASLAGAPRLVVSDGSKVTIPTAEQAFPDATIRLCRWHLKRLFSRNLNPVLKRNPFHAIADFDSDVVDDPEAWATFKALASDPDLDAVDREVLDKWVKGRDKRLMAEFAATDLPDHWGNGAIEQALDAIGRHIGPRAFCFRNAERTNRLLELVRLHHNGVDDTGRYANAIRDHLHALHTGTLPAQGLVRDPRGAPSLR